jgi:hypothetical protein
LVQGVEKLVRHYWLVSEEAEVYGHGVDKRKNKSEKRSE